MRNFYDRLNIHSTNSRKGVASGIMDRVAGKIMHLCARVLWFICSLWAAELLCPSNRIKALLQSESPRAVGLHFCDCHVMFALDKILFMERQKMHLAILPDCVSWATRAASGQRDYAFVKSALRVSDLDLLKCSFPMHKTTVQCCDEPPCSSLLSTKEFSWQLWSTFTCDS